MHLLGLLENYKVRETNVKNSITTGIIHKCDGMFCFPMFNRASKLTFIQKY